ncbi:MAG: SH3 domain-containing protein [Lachnospiraceae bacterium]|nr:SH3 domain-containing protein [Robinsoniella sp.]MDY3765900.1 SH3 domain-containing protein [Lachnospiraceae bacterium]
MDNFREWVSDNLRYILLGLAIVLVLVVAIFAARLIKNATGGRSNNEVTQETPVQETSENGAKKGETDTEASQTESTATKSQGNLTKNDPAILAIVQKYYKAHQDHDTVTLQKIVNPYTEEMENDLDNASIVSYNNIETYSEAGPKDRSYIVCVYYEQQIQDLDALVPQLALLYLRTDDEGFLYIADPNEDETTKQAVEAFSEEEEVVKIINETKEKTRQLRDSDEGVRKWLQQMAADEGQTETDVQTDPNESVMHANTDDVNIRSESNTDSEILGVLSQGDEVTVLGDAGNGWINIEFQGITGYVANEFLSE